MCSSFFKLGRQYSRTAWPACHRNISTYSFRSSQSFNIFQRFKPRRKVDGSFVDELPKPSVLKPFLVRHDIYFGTGTRFNQSCSVLRRMFLYNIRCRCTIDQWRYWQMVRITQVNRWMGIFGTDQLWASRSQEGSFVYCCVFCHVIYSPNH